MIDAQTAYGITVITDGEIYRDVYIFHFLRQLEGVDFENPEDTVYRNGACSARLPCIIGTYWLKASHHYNKFASVLTVTA